MEDESGGVHDSSGTRRTGGNSERDDEALSASVEADFPGVEPGEDSGDQTPLEAVDPVIVTVQAGPGAGGQTTEWFSVEEAFDFEDDTSALPRRRHHVTAVVVGHDGEVWLPAVLTTLAQQSRPLDAVVGVDTGSEDGTRAMMEGSFGPERVTTAAGRSGFGAAVSTGLTRLAPARDDSPDVLDWVWLLHDDSAPDRACLEQLLSTADDHPSVAVLGPKVLGWHDRRLLLEVGVTISGAGRRITGIERREHDQGQHDGPRDVLAVSSAGMLVRRDVWDALEGFDPTLPLFRDDLDFCWRAHQAGERVLIATDAVIHHREASAHGRRAHDLAPQPHRVDREAAVHVLLAHAGALVAPFVALRLLVGSLGRALLYLLGKDVSSAREEVAAVLALALHPSKVTSSRELIARTTSQPSSVVRHLRPTIRSQFRQAVEVVGGVLTTSGSAGPSTAVSGLDSGPVGDDVDFLDDGSSGLLKRILTAPAFLLVALLTIAAVVGTRDLWLGDGVLQGGALLPSPAGAGDLWQTYTRAWHDVGPGSVTPAPPYLTVLAAVAFVLLGKAPAAVSVALLLGIPLAGMSAYITLRGLVPRTGIRFWAAAAYALLPAMTGALSSGRVGTTILAIALPFALRSLVRISSARGTIRRAAGTALLMSVVLSVAPAIWVLLLVAGLLAGIWLVRRPDGPGSSVLGRLAIALLAPLVLLLPWSAYVLANPALLLLEPGLNGGPITDRELAPWHVLLLHPGGPGMTPVWITAGLVLAGFLALLRRDRWRLTGGFAVLGGLALVVGLLQIVVLVTPPGASAELRPWPGQAVLVLSLALIAMAAIAVDGLRDRFIGSNFTLGQPLALVVALTAILAPILSAVWLGAGLSSVVRKEPASSLPAFVAADAESAQAPRTLIIATDVAGRVKYSLINGTGPLLGDAETGPPASVWEALDPFVAAMASGRGGDEIEALAGYGVRYVVMAPGSLPELIPTLDGEPGLRRLSSSGGEVLWRVAGVTTRARILEGDLQEPVGVAPDGTLTADPYIQQQLPDGGAERLLVAGVTAGGEWNAAVIDADGGRTALMPVEADGIFAWSQAFAVPQGAPDVEVSFDGSARGRWLVLQLIVVLALIIMALPERRREDPDPDDDLDLPSTAEIAMEPALAHMAHMAPAESAVPESDESNGSHEPAVPESDESDGSHEPAVPESDESDESGTERPTDGSGS